MAGEKEINVLELRKHLGETLEQVHAEKQTYVVTKNGRPTAILLDISIYKNLLRPPTLPPVVSSEPPRKEEDSFIELYTKERIEEFRQEDQLKNRPAG